MDSPTPADPMPLPPHQPDLDECCGNGCDPCIFELHDMAMDGYRQALRAWRVRNPDTDRPDKADERQTGISSQT